MMFASIAIQSIIITMKLPNNEWYVKKTIDQSKLSTSCTANIKIANLTSLLFKPSRHTRNNAIPINMYNVVHTGPNNQFGGAHEGLDSAEYHVGICDMVTIDPTDPITKGISIDTMSLGISFNL